MIMEVLIRYRLWDGGVNTGIEKPDMVSVPANAVENTVKGLKSIGAYCIESSTPFIMNKNW